MNATVNQAEKITYCKCSNPEIIFETVLLATCGFCSERINKTKLMRYRDSKARVLTKRYHEFFKSKDKNFTDLEKEIFFDKFSDEDRMILTWIINKGAKE